MDWLKALDEARLRPVVTIAGAEGPDAEFINGSYVLQDTDDTEPPAFRGCDGTVRWLFRAKNGTWCVGPGDAKVMRIAMCWAYSSVAAPGVLPTLARGWQVTVGDYWQPQELQVEARPKPEPTQQAGRARTALSQPAATAAKPPHTALFDFDSLETRGGPSKEQREQPRLLDLPKPPAAQPLPVQHPPTTNAAVLANAQALAQQKAVHQARAHNREAALAVKKQVPQILRLNLPNGQISRGGVYVLDEDEMPNGHPMWKHATKDSIIYSMLNGKWGVAGSNEYNHGNSNLAYVFCPVEHGGLMPSQVKCLWKYWSHGKWIADRDASVKVAQDANAPKLTLVDCMSMEDELIAEYEKPEFQRRFHEAWSKAGGDQVREREARVLMCLPIQIKVIQKYGFEPTLKGVQQSVRAFTPFNHMTQLYERSMLMTWLINPYMQATQRKPANVPFNTIGQSLRRSAESFTVVARLLSGEELLRLAIDPAENFTRLREVVEDALGGTPLKLVFNGNVLADNQAAKSAGLSDGSEVFIVFLHFTVLTASADFTAMIINTTTGESELTFDGHSACVRSATMSHDGSSVVAVSSDGTAKIFNAKSTECTVTFAAHRKSVNSAVFSKDDSKVLTSSDDGYIKLHSVTTGECVAVFPNGGDTANSAVFSPDGHFILVASGDSTAKLVNVKTGSHEQRFGGHRDAVNSAVFSADGVQVVTASDDCTCKVFEVPTGICAALLLGHSRPVNSAIFDSSGTQVISASDDCTVRLFDIVSGGCTQLFQIHNACAYSALILPDERHVVVASSDGNVRLFHIGNGECQKTMKVHSGRIHSLSLC